MQLSELKTRLRTAIGNPSEVDVTSLKITELVNDAVRDITDRYRFHKARKRCIFTTIEGQSQYGLPDGCEVVLRLWDITNRKKLEKIGDRQLSSQTDLADATGVQIKYVRYRDYVELYPTPMTTGDEIEVFYKYLQPILSADTDVPGIPGTWHLGIVLYAKWLYYVNEQNDIPKGEAAYQTFKLWVRDKPTEIDEESVDIDSGVDVLTLSQDITPRQDFNHAD